MNYQCDMIVDNERCYKQAVEMHKDGFLLCNDCRKTIILNPHKINPAQNFGKSYQEMRWEEGHQGI